MLKRFFDDEIHWLKARRDYEKELARHESRERKTKPDFKPPVFLTFVRTPYVTAFEAPAANDAPPLTFTAVNAHLVYGTMREREQEFDALLDWLIMRLKKADRLVTPNFLLLGDLNLNFDQPHKDRARIDAKIRASNARAFGNPDTRRVYFPLLDKHPKLKKFLKDKRPCRPDVRPDRVFYGENGEATSE